MGLASLGVRATVTRDPTLSLHDVVANRVCQRFCHEGDIFLCNNGLSCRVSGFSYYACQVE
jgi:hypothetical protein